MPDRGKRAPLRLFALEDFPLVQPGDDLVDPAIGFISFETWAKARPIQQQFLSLNPGYSEPNIEIINKEPLVELAPGAHDFLNGRDLIRPMKH